MQYTPLLAKVYKNVTTSLFHNHRTLNALIVAHTTSHIINTKTECKCN